MTPGAYQRLVAATKLSGAKVAVLKADLNALLLAAGPPPDPKAIDRLVTLGPIPPKPGSRLKGAKR